MPRKAKVVDNVCNVDSNTIFTRDNLEVLEGINSNSVDLIYLDPPFNSNRNYSAPIGSDAAGAAFVDTWHLDEDEEYWLTTIEETKPEAYHVIMAAGETAGDNMKAYLIYMYPRLMEMYRVLKSTGSIYLHVDPTASHYLKVLMDGIFGAKSFVNEIIWHYNKWANSAKYFQKNHDNLLFYVKSEDYTYNKLYGKYTKSMLDIRSRGYNGGTKNGKRILRVYDINNPKAISKMKEYENSEIYIIKNPDNGAPIPSVWNDIGILVGKNNERTGYPTQKPLALLERIIKASSNPGDIVLDPFCGCATACVAAENLGRKWIGIDVSPKAFELVNIRLRRELGLVGGIFTNHLTDIPVRTGTIEIPTRWERGLKAKLYREQEGLCKNQYCAINTSLPIEYYEIDHIKPKSKGGTYESSNAQLLCSPCNRKKRDRSMDDFEQLMRILNNKLI